MSLPETQPICPHCNQPMVKVGELFDKDVKTAENFSCSCRGTLFWKNYHAGQKEKENART